MSLDLFLRAEDKSTLKTVVLSTPFRNIIGDLTARDENGDVLTDEFSQIPGSVDWTFFRVGDVKDGIGGVDSWVWLHLRLTGSAETEDLDGVNDQSDRWDRSKIRAWMEANGVIRTIRGVKVYEHTLGNGKLIQVWRGSEMVTQGVLFNEFFGGNEY